MPPGCKVKSKIVKKKVNKLFDPQTGSKEASYFLNPKSSHYHAIVAGQLPCSRGMVPQVWPALYAEFAGGDHFAAGCIVAVTCVYPH